MTKPPPSSSVQRLLGADKGLYLFVLNWGALAGLISVAVRRDGHDTLRSGIGVGKLDNAHQGLPSPTTIGSAASESHSIGIVMRPT
jgi:hypothetical protein